MVRNRTRLGILIIISGTAADYLMDKKNVLILILKLSGKVPRLIIKSEDNLYFSLVLFPAGSPYKN